MEVENVHFGHWLRGQIAARGISSRQFAANSRIHYTTIQRWSDAASPRIYGYMLTRLCEGLGMPQSAIERVLTRAKVAEIVKKNPGLEKKWNQQIGVARSLGPNPSIVDQIAAGLPIGEEEDETNVDPYSEEMVPEIPLFEMPLAAGRWTEVTEFGEVSDPMMIDHGRFRVRLRGDSMEPQYKDGTVVEFVCLRGDNDQPQPGGDYYVHRSDGCATFKRLHSADEHQLILSALNKKYKKLTVARQEVVRMALAVAKVELIV